MALVSNSTAYTGGVRGRRRAPQKLVPKCQRTSYVAITHVISRRPLPGGAPVRDMMEYGKGTAAWQRRRCRFKFSAASLKKNAQSEI